MDNLSRLRDMPRGKGEQKAELPILVATERVEAILFLLHEHRALSSTQIEEFLFLHGYSKQHTKRLLSKLEAHKLIDQINKKWKFRTIGTPPRIWGLGNEGGVYLEKKYGILQRKARWSDKNREIKPDKVEHHRLIADIMLAFERSCKKRGDVRLIGAQEIIERAPIDLRRELKPFQWQVPVSWDGQAFTLSIEPDKIFGLQFFNDPEQAIYWNKLEGDTGSETVMPDNPTNLKKTNTIFHKYLAYFYTHEKNIHTKRFGFKRFRTLSLTEKIGVQVHTDPATGEKRAITRTQWMQETALRVGSTVPGLFLFADRKLLLEHDDVLSMPWQNARGRTVYLDPNIRE